MEQSRENKRKDIRNCLMAQIKQNGITVKNEKHIVDLVEDYMKLWDTKEQLSDDIKARGVTVEVVTAAGVNIKKNESVSELVKVNDRMTKLLDFLHITPDAGGDDDDDEM